MEPSLEELKVQATEIVNAGDINSLTMKSVFEQLQSKSGCELDKQAKEEIRATVKAALEKRTSDEATKAESKASDEPPAKKKKIGTSSGSTQATAEAKGEMSFPPKAIALGKDTCAQVEEWKGQKRVDIRTYYIDKDTGATKPSPKGIFLTPEEWAEFTKLIPDVQKHLQDVMEMDKPLEADGLKRMTVQGHKGKFSVHIRNYYKDNEGELKPTKKGVTLDRNEFQVLVESREALFPGSPSTAARAKNEVAAAKSTGPQIEWKANGNQYKGEITESEGITYYELNGKIRAYANQYNGKKLVNVREFYSKDGQMLPGSSGVALNKEQFSKLCEVAQDLSGALTAREERGIPLSAKNARGEVKQASVSGFKGVFRVGIREWYTDKKTDELKPTKKGVNLTSAEWEILKGRFAELSATFD